MAAPNTITLGGQNPLISVYSGEDSPMQKPSQRRKGYWARQGDKLDYIGDKYDEKIHRLAGTLGWSQGKTSGGQMSYSPMFNDAWVAKYTDPEGNQWDSEDAYKQSGMAPRDLDGLTPEERAKKPNQKIASTPVGPADVKANAAIPAPQKSIAEQQADYIRSRGGRTAAEADNEMNAGLRKEYSKLYGYDIDTAEGRQASFSAALGRMRPNALQANGIKEFKRADGSIGAYSTLPDAIIPESTANGSSGTTYRERAYGKHFATPEAGTNGTPYMSGGNWTGNNPVTGDFKDPEGNIWAGEKAFRNSQLGESGLVETDGIPEDNTPYQPLQADPLPPMSPEAQQYTDKAQGYADNVIAGIMRKRTQETAQGMANDQLRYAKAADYYRRNDAGKAYVINAQGKRQMEPVEPEMTTEDYVRQGNVLATQGAKSKLPPAYRTRRIEPPMSTQDYIRQGLNMQRRGNKENYDTRGYNGQM